jgi:hypothetical protein
MKLLAVKINGMNIRYIKNPTNEMKLEAVKYDTHSIQFIKDPSFEVLDELISEKNKNYLNKLIKYVDIIKYPELYDKYEKIMKS